MIEKDKLCWVLQTDVICLNDDGCIFDACLLALVGAIMKLKLPELALDESSQKMIVPEETTWRGVKFSKLPLSCTFGLHKG